MAFTAATFGGELDVLVNNAGNNRRGPIDTVTEEDGDGTLGGDLCGMRVESGVALKRAHESRHALDDAVRIFLESNGDGLDELG